MEKMSRYFLAAILALSVGLTVGCTKKPPVGGDAGGAPVSPAPVVHAGDMDAGMAPSVESLDNQQGGAGGAGGSGGAYGSAGGPGGIGAGPVYEGKTSAPMLPVYFDFDQYNIRGDQVTRIEKNAEYLQRAPGVAVIIEGNCDERGTNEYNISLGEKRALAAKKYLVNLGLTPSRLKAISYGEEKPLLYGHDEMSWAQNRRVDFVISRY